MQITSINLERGIVCSDRGEIPIKVMFDCLGEETSIPELAEQLILEVPLNVWRCPGGQWMRISLSLFKLPTLH